MCHKHTLKIKIAMGSFVPVELLLPPDLPWIRSSQLRHTSPAHRRRRPRAGYLRCLAAYYLHTDAARPLATELVGAVRPGVGHLRCVVASYYGLLLRFELSNGEPR